MVRRSLSLNLYNINRHEKEIYYSENLCRYEGLPLCPSYGYGTDAQNAGQAAAKQNNFDESENEDNGLWNFKVWDVDEY